MTMEERNIQLLELKLNGLCLRGMSASLRDDQNFVRVACEENGHALSFASTRLRDDDACAHAAVSNNWRALQFASHRLKCDPALVLRALKRNANALMFASDTLNCNLEVMKIAVSGNGFFLERCSAELKADRPIVLAAVSQNGLVLRYASEKLRSDKMVVLAAVASEANALVFASEELREGAGRVLKAFAEQKLEAHRGFAGLVLQAAAARHRLARPPPGTTLSPPLWCSFPERAWRSVAEFASVPVGWELAVLRTAAKRRGWAAWSSVETKKKEKPSTRDPPPASRQPTPSRTGAQPFSSGAENTGSCGAGGGGGGRGGDDDDPNNGRQQWRRPLVLCGPGSRAKAAVVDGLLKTRPDLFSRVVRHTSRRRRAHEVDGVDFHFVTQQAMAKAVEGHEFVETTTAATTTAAAATTTEDNALAAAEGCSLNEDHSPHPACVLYATSKSEILKAARDGKIGVVDMSLESALRLRHLYHRHASSASSPVAPSSPLSSSNPFSPEMPSSLLSSSPPSTITTATTTRANDQGTTSTAVDSLADFRGLEPHVVFVSPAALEALAALETELETELETALETEREIELEQELETRHRSLEFEKLEGERGQASLAGSAVSSRRSSGSSGAASSRGDDDGGGGGGGGGLCSGEASPEEVSAAEAAAAWVLKAEKTSTPTLSSSSSLLSLAPSSSQQQQTQQTQTQQRGGRLHPRYRHRRSPAPKNSSLLAAPKAAAAEEETSHPGEERFFDVSASLAEIKCFLALRSKRTQTTPLQDSASSSSSSSSVVAQTTGGGGVDLFLVADGDSDNNAAAGSGGGGLRSDGGGTPLFYSCRSSTRNSSGRDSGGSSGGSIRGSIDYSGILGDTHREVGALAGKNAAAVITTTTTTTDMAVARLLDLVRVWHGSTLPAERSPPTRTPHHRHAPITFVANSDDATLKTADPFFRIPSPSYGGGAVPATKNVRGGSGVRRNGGDSSPPRPAKEELSAAGSPHVSGPRTSPKRSPPRRSPTHRQASPTRERSPPRRSPTHSQASPTRERSPPRRSPTHRQASPTRELSPLRQRSPPNFRAPSPQKSPPRRPPTHRIHSHAAALHGGADKADASNHRDDDRSAVTTVAVGISPPPPLPVLPWASFDRLEQQQQQRRQQRTKSAATTATTATSTRKVASSEEAAAVATATPDESLTSRLSERVRRTRSDTLEEGRREEIRLDGDDNDDEVHLQCFAPRLFIGDIEAAVSPLLLKAHRVTHLVDLSNSFVDDHHPRDEQTGLLRKNAHYTVLKAQGEWRESCPTVEAKLVVRVDDVDGAPLADHFEAINAFVEGALASSERGGVLIHCFRGKSRSATACVQYLMQCGAPLPAQAVATCEEATRQQQQQQQQQRQETKEEEEEEQRPQEQEQERRRLTLKEAMRAVKQARRVIDINVTFKKELMDLERRLWPGDPPSVVLKLTSRRPVLSSSSVLGRRGGGKVKSLEERSCSTSPRAARAASERKEQGGVGGAAKSKSGPLKKTALRRAVTLDSTLL